MVDRTGQHIGDYRLTRLVGTGTFGETYQAEHEGQTWNVYQTEQEESEGQGQLAVKVVRQELAEHLRSHFFGEVQVLKLDHPYILAPRQADLSNSLPFLVTEWLPDGSLRQRHTPGIKVPLNQAVQYVQQIAEALQFAHDRGVVHRDLKPENLLVRTNNTVVVSDFAIGVLLHSLGSTSNPVQSRTITYAAPEQLQGQAIAASDQYALAAIAYEWLCGVQPFTGSQENIIAQHLSALPQPLRVHNPALPLAVEAVIMRALAKDPRERYPTIQAFAYELQQALQAVHPQPSFTLPANTPSYISWPSQNPAQRISVHPPYPAYTTPYTGALPQQQSVHTFSMLGGIALILGTVLAWLALWVGHTQTSVDPHFPAILSAIGVVAAGVGLVALYLRLRGNAQTWGLLGLVLYTLSALGYIYLLFYQPPTISSQDELQQALQTYSIIADTILALKILGIGLLSVGLILDHWKFPRWLNWIIWAYLVVGTLLLLLMIFGFTGVTLNDTQINFIIQLALILNVLLDLPLIGFGCALFLQPSIPGYNGNWSAPATLPVTPSGSSLVTPSVATSSYAAPVPVSTPTTPVLPVQSQSVAAVETVTPLKSDDKVESSSITETVNESPSKASETLPSDDATQRVQLPSVAEELPSSTAVSHSEPLVEREVSEETSNPY